MSLQDTEPSPDDVLRAQAKACRDSAADNDALAAGLEQRAAGYRTAAKALTRQAIALDACADKISAPAGGGAG